MGDDEISLVDTDFTGTRRLLGGTGFDALRLLGSGLTLDLTMIADNRITDIEEIDLVGTGANTLTLDFREVLNISRTSNTLIVRGTVDDTVNANTGWTQEVDEVIGSTTFHVFTQGNATLKLQAGIASPAVTRISFKTI